MKLTIIKQFTKFFKNQNQEDTMSQLTIEISSDIKAIIDAHPEIDWTEIARKSLSEYAKKVEVVSLLTQKSKLTEEDVQALDRDIKKAIAERYVQAR